MILKKERHESKEKGRKTVTNYQNINLQELLVLAENMSRDEIRNLENVPYLDLCNRLKQAIEGGLGDLTTQEKISLEKFYLWVDFDWSDGRYKDIKNEEALKAYMAQEAGHLDYPLGDEDPTMDI